MPCSSVVTISLSFYSNKKVKYQDSKQNKIWQEHQIVGLRQSEDVSTTGSRSDIGQLLASGLVESRVCLYFPKRIRSDTELGNEWLLRRVEKARDYLAPDL